MSYYSNAKTQQTQLKKLNRPNLDTNSNSAKTVRFTVKTLCYK